MPNNAIRMTAVRMEWQRGGHKMKGISVDMACGGMQMSVARAIDTVAAEVVRSRQTYMVDSILRRHHTYEPALSELLYLMITTAA